MRNVGPDRLAEEQRCQAEQQNERLVASMAAALAAIDAELGMPKDGCNSTQATLTAIRLLHAVHRDDTAEILRLHKDADRLRMLIDGEHELGVFVCDAEDGSPCDSVSRAELLERLDALLGA